MSASIDLERLRRAKEQALSYAQARLSGASPPPPRVPMLPSYFGEEGPSRDIVLAAQRSFISSWLTNTRLWVLAHREINRRREEAFAAEGLA